ncbi:MAG TPA: FAD:protein FMN transferase [Candidatus Limnocylindrales bacterium]|nr:FAD:protein FMN transferase [Candidatus Limnocylindrales bacterium]
MADGQVAIEAATVETADVLRFEGSALGSRLQLTVRGADEASANAAWRAVRDEFAVVDVSLSRYRGDSELTALNRSAGRGPVAVSRRLRVLLALTDRAHRTTDGRFDPRVLADLERLGDHGADLGDADGGAWRARAGRSSGTRARIALVFRDRTASIDAPVDSGGAGKGLALRWAASRARELLPRDAGLLLDAGGDVVASGMPPPGGWLVGVEDPLAGSDPGTAVAVPIAVLRLDVGAVATSSTRIRQWRSPAGELVHHLIDPATGEPGGDGLVAVTVALTDPAWAEICSKSLFVAGRSRIAELARATGLAAWWVDADGARSMTPAARQRCVWVDEVPS